MNNCWVCLLAILYVSPFHQVEVRAIMFGVRQAEGERGGRRGGGRGRGRRAGAGAAAAPAGAARVPARQPLRQERVRRAQRPSVRYELITTYLLPIFSLRT